MKIETVKVSLPSRRITNQDMVELIREQSHDVPQEIFDKIASRIKILLRLSGSQDRYWREASETPIELLKKSYREAMSEVGWKPEEIDLLIYVGVGRGFLEPGNAYMVAQSFGLIHADCFDLLDACMSWSRALEIVHNYFKLGKYKRVIIVNAEFNSTAFGYPEIYRVTDESMLDSRFPGYTIGEAATVTLLSNENNTKDAWEFHFSSKPNLSDLCTIPLPQFKVFTDNTSDKLGKNGPLVFTSYGSELHAYGNTEGIKLFQKLSVPREKINIVFTHASSSTAWQKGGETVGVADKMYHIYPRTGNLVSASVPAAMALALKENKLKRGDRVVCWVASAGMSFAVYSFIY
ncbi:MAG: 3-oxoacyl-[acyl-carrier-protein] synthase III C-terminal domain-containing protein [Gammaproteobacteria bacterium]|nr:3-oxoacyl-[acyl-carrier-protein] synthase III C-terminal domain-containing protein [Gammaproteobacteria bacterium]